VKFVSMVWRLRHDHDGTGNGTRALYDQDLAQRSEGPIAGLRYKHALGASEAVGVHDAQLKHRFHGHFNDQFRGGKIQSFQEQPNTPHTQTQKKRDILASIGAMLNR
jgi:hypothetical protein